MDEFLFQIFLALLGIVIGILSQLVQPRVQRWMLLIFGLLLFLSAGLWWGYSLATKELTSTQISPAKVNLPADIDPYVGIWAATDYDNSNLELSIFKVNNSYTILYYDDAGSVCGKDATGNPVFPWVGLGSGLMNKSNLDVNFSTWCLGNALRFLGNGENDFFTYDTSTDKLVLNFPGVNYPITWTRQSQLSPVVGIWATEDNDGSNMEISIFAKNGSYNILYFDNGASVCGKDNSGSPIYPWIAVGAVDQRQVPLKAQTSAWCLSPMPSFDAQIPVEINYNESYKLSTIETRPSGNSYTNVLNRIYPK